MPRPRLRHVLHAAVLIGGLVALAVLIDQVGPDGFATAVLDTGYWFVVIAAIDVASMVCDAGGVYWFVRPQAPVGFARVFAAQASGLAVNRLTPGNSLGEPIKVTMLIQHVPEAAAVSAIVMFNLATYLVAVAAIAIGVPITLLMLDLSARAEIAVLVVTGVLIAGIWALIVLARRGALAASCRAGRRLRILSVARAERWERRLAEIDASIRTFGDRGNRLGFAFVLGSRLLNMAGAIVILIATGIELTGPLVIGTLSVGILITWISNVIPLGLGLADGGNYALYGVLGATPGAGLEFAMINRVRTVVLASVGLVVMLVASVIPRRDSRKLELER